MCLSDAAQVNPSSTHVPGAAVGPREPTPGTAPARDPSPGPVSTLCAGCDFGAPSDPTDSFRRDQEALPHGLSVQAAHPQLPHGFGEAAFGEGALGVTQTT